MGITIHFQGSLKDTNQVKELVEEMVDISKSLEWEWQVLDEDWTMPMTARLVHSKDGAEIIGHLPIKGISINIHPDCEPLMLFFDSNGAITTPISMILFDEGKIERNAISSSVKTQFAPADIHITIIKLLKYLKKRYIPDLNVIDEGEYWQSEDEEQLMKKQAFLNEKIDAVKDVLSTIKKDKNYTAERLADLIEKILKKRL
ncbi:hypothetical protein JXO59_06645 [candidate division KSB1 bacterium]|nr:hypothetical protein [candidate division KSB1 bacterium]